MEHESRDFKVRVLETVNRRTLTLSELQGLDVLTTPAWVFDQKRREVPWANGEAQKAYFKRHSFESNPYERTIHESTVKFYAMVEDEGCTVHITGPRRVLLAGVRSPFSRDRDDADDIVTLVVSPIVLTDVRTTEKKNLALFHEIAITDLKFDHTLDIQTTDTPLDVIIKMLDEASHGFQVPMVHAKFVRDLLRDGADIHQPIIFAKSFVMTTEGLSKRNKLCDIMGLDLFDDKNNIKKIETNKAESSRRDSTELYIDYSEILDSDIDTWNFDAFSLDTKINGNLLSKLLMKLLDKSNVINILDLDKDRLIKFVIKIEEGYNVNNPYHNAMHASSVLHSMYKILTSSKIIDEISSCEREKSLLLLIGYIAAVVHDFRHSGMTNKFLIDTASPAAIIYNDTSPQENFHTASAFKILLDDNYNFFKNFEKQETRKFRNLIINMVMQTDMQQHFPLLTKFKSRFTHEKKSIIEEGDSTLILQMALKAADLAHLTYNFDLHKKWVELLQEEMFIQGDIERSMGLPESPLCDRSKQGIIDSQTDFINFVALGMYNALALSFPSTIEMYNMLIKNYNIWESKTNI
jgi:hypothetical protein